MATRVAHTGAHSAPTLPSPPSTAVVSVPGTIFPSSIGDKPLGARPFSGGSVVEIRGCSGIGLRPGKKRFLDTLFPLLIGVHLFRTRPDLCAVVDNHEIIYDIDRRTLYFAQETGFLVTFDTTIQSLVPHPAMASYRSPDGRHPLMVYMWDVLRTAVGDFVRDVATPAEGPESDDWENSALTMDELVHDANATGGDFIEFVRGVARDSGSDAHFGPGDGKKAPRSLHGKVEDKVKSRSHGPVGDPQEEVVQHIGDAIRGSLVFETPEHLRAGIEVFKRCAVGQRIEIAFGDKWNEPITEKSLKKLGYVAVHAKFRMPVTGAPDKYIICELQFHIKEIFDGSESCLKEILHRLYKAMQMREEQRAKLKNDPDTHHTAAHACPKACASACQLSYTAHIWHAHRKHLSAHRKHMRGGSTSPIGMLERSSATLSTPAPSTRMSEEEAIPPLVAMPRVTEPPTWVEARPRKEEGIRAPAEEMPRERTAPPPPTPYLRVARMPKGGKSNGNSHFRGKHTQNSKKYSSSSQRPDLHT